MIQTLAIFKDAYRELNSKRLFWVVLSVTVAVVIAFALLGNNERGMTVVGYTLEIPFLSTRAVSPAGFYKFIFSNVGVNFWLTWGATILALISTAGMIPDFVASGSIDMSLSKPIGRLRLFLTKYAAGLLFVALQVVAFAVGAFIVIGLRGGAWEPSVFLAVPIVVIFYSYLFCICALVGLVTRSGITALLVTMVFWLFVWAVGTAEVQLLSLRLDAKREMERDQGQIRLVERGVEMLNERVRAAESGSAAVPTDPALTSELDALATPISAATPGPDTADNPPPRPPRPPGRARRDRERLASLADRLRSAATPTDDPAELQRRLAEQQVQLETLQRSASENESSYRSLTRWQTGLYTAKTLLPKTGETTDLLKRYVIDKEDRDGFLKIVEEQTGDSAPKDIQDALDARSIGWVVGTSMAFQALVLALAAFIFCRRDF